MDLISKIINKLIFRLTAMPLTPSLKKGGGISTDFPSKQTPPFFREGQGWVLKAS